MFTPTLSVAGTLPTQQLLDTADDGTGTAPLDGAPVFRAPLPVPVDSEPAPMPFAPPADAPAPSPPVFRPVPDDPIPQQPVFHPAPTTPAFVSPPVTLVDSPDDPAQHPADTPAGPSATPATPGVLNPFVHGDPTIPGPSTFVPGSGGTPTPSTHFSPSNGQRMPVSEFIPPPLIPQVSPVIILPAGQKASDSGGLSNGGDSTGGALSPLWMVAAVAAFVLFLRK